MATELAAALSRTPSPTLPSTDAFDVCSDVEAATNTDISSDSEADDNGNGSDDDYDDEDHYFLDTTLFSKLVKSLTAITEASIDSLVGTSTTSLRKYYLRKLTEIAKNPEYRVPLTDPPCPHITIKAADDMRYSPECSMCPCCLPDEIPELKIVAEDVQGGEITYQVMLQKTATWLYGPDQEEPLGLGQESTLAQTVDGIPAGEAGVISWNYMSDANGDEPGVRSVMGLELFLYFAKPLLEGGMHNSYRSPGGG